MGEFRYEKDADGIVTVTMDMDGPVNAMNAQFDGLYQDMTDRLCAEDGLTGVVLTSAKKTFFAGGDLKWLIGVQPGQEQEIYENVERTKANMRRLEKLGVPVVAAINGAAAGGGFEICLACHYRIAADLPQVKIGLPEVTLGLLPGGGGVVRMTYLLGIEGAMPFALEGRMVSAQKALNAGIVHEVTESIDALVPRAKAYITSVAGDAAACTQPWDDRKYRIPGGPSNTAAAAPRLAVGSAMLYKKTRDLLPAPGKIMDIMANTASNVDFDGAQRYESRQFASLVPLPVTKNMIQAFFFDLNKVNGGAARPGDVPQSKVGKLGILGAGMMGQGIAYSAAMAGIEVVLKDTGLDAAERGKGHTAKLLETRVAKGRMEQAQADAVLARITPTDSAEALAGCDLIIEAVFERIDVKESVLAEHETLLGDAGFWGSNTSTLPIGRLAQAATRPEKFIGLHFFSPVDKMPLLEIVVGEKTDDETLARAFDFARQIGKTPIVVNASTGFYTSRTIGTKMDEAVQMVAEGLDPVRVENLSRAVGFPTGLLTLYDEVKLSLALDIFDTQLDMGLRRAEDDPTPEARSLLRALVAEGRKGRGTGGGFFDYSDDGKAPWPGLAQWRKADADIPDADIKDRMLFRAVLETLRCLDEGVLRATADANIGSIMGIGAPAWTGGYAQFVETYGRARFIARCEELAAEYGPRFAPPESLRKAA
ncbi:3-hydroxyacyl-CoA dehydrogenase NAD-binding domain-containing protein [Lutimaribacter sp. EGI FJ00015]|uniref:3-hydroxyacyl-CoA dehydrogenase NAD-binding domain-containing protein n=1 Tax=Lutimaribacter degradans TaxID=2945989 RepID=A0ACC5ZV82_9RHOB|nr:3-hydroxyacyl-CoA dehydrogenase NAD-binding domain-containing protein [Lutimaribacter sp. EGI FJ00013]MCM2562093.1 3-hydroxyacyl-CoA dehydrogenase NAD-binding domain-containing protein [Lutimaribacter sp. EGI FJ00013]MCO0613246.1 3-hydroxyacyl-CoA dehydrogenase NAD-binding domain-containing protein [Lutimaribacter sp. EGI FJ00015]MCO0636223.1 3-hydroxyacyl-CoA dehydrogenase NAD-binding domain-containing protein [Lutimaribacter sp. EGI FJ00014]